MSSADDHRFMARALQLAAFGLASADPNPRVGCVLVAAGQSVGEGYHQRTGQAHAEVNALAQAGVKSRGATAYVTLEPCCHHGRTPPCTDALINAGVTRVIAAMVDPDPRVAGQGLRRLSDAGLAVSCGLMEDQARALNVGFVSRLTRGRPWVRLKLAMSLDGRTAMASGESQWITGPEARADVHRWRSRCSAILTGAATVLADDPALTVRTAQKGVRQPLRVIVDPALRTPADAQTIRLPGRTQIYSLVTHDPARRAALIAAGAEILTVAPGSGGVDLREVLSVLAGEQCNEVHVESGARLAGALLQAQLVDELLLYVAPKLLGSNARGLVELPGIEQLCDGINIDIIEQRRIGADWRIIGAPTYVHRID